MSQESALPITTLIPQLLDALSCREQIVLKASTGAGKSTYLPLTLLKKKCINGKIIMLEPRRLAARNIAYYLASQLGEKIGESVGFRIKGESRVSRHTRLEVVTEGVMARMIQSDPELNGIGLLIFDEFHERSIHADSALAFALEIQEALRDDLKLLIMSATLQPQEITRLLPHAVFLESEGRQFPVDVRYQAPKVNQRIVDTVENAILKAISQEEGSILVFLSGVSEIKTLEARLQQSIGLKEIIVAPLYGQLDSQKQQQALQPASAGKRKIVLSTNIAETSLTIEGIRIVIDSGYERRAMFDPRIGITKLEQKWITQSSAEQRKGRAGRVEEGICIRLYSESHYQQFAATQTPEIESVDLTSLVLEVAKWGVSDPLTLKWLTPPSFVNIQQARNLLTSLGFIDKKGTVTTTGERAYQLGIEPRLAAMLLQAEQVSMAHFYTALYSIPIIEEPHKSIASKDISVHLNLFLDGKYPRQAYYQQQAERLMNAIKRSYSDKSSICLELIGEVFAGGFPDRIAIAREQIGQFQLANGHGVQVDDIELIAQSQYLVVVDLLKSRSDRSQIFLAAEITKASILTTLSGSITITDYVDWDERLGRVIAEKRTYLGKIILDKQRIESVDKEQITQALLTMITRKGLDCLHWDKAAKRLYSRLLCMETWFADPSIPSVKESVLLNNIDVWLSPFMIGLNSEKQVKEINLVSALEAYVGWDTIKKVNEWLPSHYLLPTGTKAPIVYDTNNEPKISVKMQEVYGESQTPLLAQGKKRLVMELLSPALRPLQTTSDLASFWQGAYKEVQKEMKGRYPKHVWPDDPATHRATKQTKRHMKPS